MELTSLSSNVHMVCPLLTLQIDTDNQAIGTECREKSTNGYAVSRTTNQ